MFNIKGQSRKNCGDKKGSLGEDLYLKSHVVGRYIFEDLGIPRRCGTFNIKDNKRDKVIKIILPKLVTHF